MTGMAYGSATSQPDKLLYPTLLPNNHFPKNQQMTHLPKSYVGSIDNTSVEAAGPPDSF